MRFIKFIGLVVIITLRNSVIFPYETIAASLDVADKILGEYKRAYNKFITRKGG
jgi:hypothetical protein